jgi:hypothetical protein
MGFRARAALPSYGDFFFNNRKLWPDWRRILTTPAAVSSFLMHRLRRGDFPHGVVEAQTQDLNEEVDGVASPCSIAASASSSL